MSEPTADQEDLAVQAMAPIEIEASEREWKSPDGRHVYIIEIDPSLYPHLSGEVPAGKHAFYVGQTCKAPRLRLAQHCLGARRMERRDPNREVPSKAGKPFKKIVRAQDGQPLRPGLDAWLRDDLMADIPNRLEQDEAKRIEREVADRLEAEGHWVHCN